jgi:uncharacterized protein YabN with tetrapyrrole methylase and pyrophosphatase domain
MSEPESARTGSLTIVGSGIRAGLQTTQEARVRIERADKVLYLLAEIAPTAWIRRLNGSAESLAPLYGLGRPHADVYEDIVTTILSWVRRDLDVCVAFYGHPCVFDQTSHEALRRARDEGFRARILPGISAEDCLYVDLGLDPGEDGCQSFDATDFLVFGRRPDVSVPLILWQISVIGGTLTANTVNRSSLQILADRLQELYGPDHEVVVYEATPFPVGNPIVQRCAVHDLASAGVTGLSSLYVPPKPRSDPDPDMMARLGVSR